MLQALIGQKIDQTQTFLENGKRIPVTEVSVSDNVVVQVKTDVKDSYTAIQLGIGAKKKPSKSLAGHSKKAGLENVPQHILEVAWEGSEELPKAGDVVTVETVFKPGDIVKVTGTSKGKGFAGGVRRYNFRGGPKTHGQSDRHRAPGSIGQGTTPGRVYKGKRMAGHMGDSTVTISNLVVVDVDSDNKKLYVFGLIPGNKKAAVVITKTGEKKKFVRLLSVKQREDEETAKEQEEAAKLAEAAKTEDTSAKPSQSEQQIASETVTDTNEVVTEATSDVVEEEVTSDTTDSVEKNVSQEPVKEGEDKNGSK